ncbi:MAG: chromate transport protein [Firmicutes bacterium]|nr:chromate transport protein [Bacillota bacterium]
MNKLYTMFLSFLKIGAFTFGGGYAMVPLIEAEVVEKRKWLTAEEFVDILVISQTFPGAIAVNTSIFIGYKISGIVGAVLALLGTILPSFFIILLVVSFFMQFRENHYVDLVFKGIGAAVPAMVLAAVFSLTKSMKKSYLNIIIISLSVASISLLHVHPVIVILVSGMYGYFFLGRKVE